MINYDKLRTDLQDTLEDAGLERATAVFKIEKMIAELQREDFLKEKIKRDIKNKNDQSKVFNKIFGNYRF